MPEGVIKKIKLQDTEYKKKKLNHMLRRHLGKKQVSET